MFALQPSFPGRQRGLGPFADFRPLSRLANKTHQAGHGILAVLILGAEPPGIDDQVTFPGHSLSG